MTTNTTLAGHQRYALQRHDQRDAFLEVFDTYDARALLKAKCRALTAVADGARASALARFNALVTAFGAAPAESTDAETLARTETDALKVMAQTCDAVLDAVYDIAAFDRQLTAPVVAFLSNAFDARATAYMCKGTPWAVAVGFVAACLARAIDDDGDVDPDFETHFAALAGCTQGNVTSARRLRAFFADGRLHTFLDARDADAVKQPLLLFLTEGCFGL